MRLGRIRGHNVRLFERFELQAAPGLNLIIGENAAGKTSLLEALFVLARGRSFRARSLSEMSGGSGRDWTVSAEVQQTTDRVERVGVGWLDGERQVRVDGQRVAAFSELAERMPLQWIDPTAHRLLDDGPSIRRAYIDWGVFHVEPSYLALWRRARRVLQQRNHALRQGQPDAALRGWDRELEKVAVEMDRARRAHVEAISPIFTRLMARLLEQSEHSLSWYAGWSRERALSAILADNMASQRSTGITPVGPQRAELKLRHGAGRDRGRLSRGQQKLCVSALVLAQAEIIAARRDLWPVILIDDFTAELSAAYQQRFAETLREYPGQIFVTSFEPVRALAEPIGAVFHVERGQLRRVESI